MFDPIAGALQKVYGGISGIMTLIAAVVIAICTVGMMASKNQRTVEEFKMWRNRIMISWVVFFMLGAIVNFGTELTSGMGFNPKK